MGVRGCGRPRAQPRRARTSGSAAARLRRSRAGAPLPLRGALGPARRTGDELGEPRGPPPGAPGGARRPGARAVGLRTRAGAAPPPARPRRGGAYRDAAAERRVVALVHRLPRHAVGEHRPPDERRGPALRHPGPAAHTRAPPQRRVRRHLRAPGDRRGAPGPSRRPPPRREPGGPPAPRRPVGDGPLPGAPRERRRPGDRRDSQRPRDQRNAAGDRCRGEPPRRRRRDPFLLRGTRRQRARGASRAMLFAAFCAAATVVVCATRAWRSVRAPAVEADLPRVAARLNGVHCLCSTDADRQSLTDSSGGPNAEDLSGPPPGPLRELPPRRCRSVALDGASELDLRIVFSETGREDALRVTGGEPSGLTLRENGRYTLGLRDAEVDGCAEPAAVRDLLRRLREIGARGRRAERLLRARGRIGPRRPNDSRRPARRALPKRRRLLGPPPGSCHRASPRDAAAARRRPGSLAAASTSAAA